jgi:hypothetical protein
MDIELKCPHCNEYFVVNTNQINCAIFRHAVYRNNMQPINPHENKENCEMLINNGVVYGCAKPFRIINQNNTYTVEVCDYI